MRTHCIKAAFLYSALIYFVTLVKFYITERIREIPGKNSTQHKLVFSKRSINFRYLLLPDIKKCNNLSVQFLTIVLSRVDHYKNRLAIRETWASTSRSKFVQNGTIAVYFIISAPKFRFEYERLTKEQQLYNDIIVTDIVESYKNLILKVYAMLMFFQQYCSNVNYLIKIDDDVTVILDRMLSIWSMGAFSEHNVYCQRWNSHAPVRNPFNKWYVPMKVWPKTSYPNYCDGPLYVVGRKAVQALIENTSKFPPFSFEDVFFTGIVAESAGIRRLNWSESMVLTDEQYFRAGQQCDRLATSTVVAVHSLPSPSSLRTGYEEALNFRCDLRKSSFFSALFAYIMRSDESSHR